MAYNILHVLAFLDNQNIPLEMATKVAKFSDNRRVNEHLSDSENEDAIDAAARLREFSFLSLHTSDWGHAYKMHKLAQEATRYGLGVKGDEAYFATTVLPQSRRELWGEGEKYLVHAQRVGEWAELYGKEKAAVLLTRISDYLSTAEGGERERAYGLRRRVLDEKHPDTIWSMAGLTTTYYALGRYNETEKIHVDRWH
ncbi:hypothetical protein RB595_004065 [Gaeumannomyces hyphopodioides]